MRAALILLLVTVVSVTVGNSASILIEHFPGMSDSYAKQYHGYLNVTNNHVIHYWFIESQNNATTDPLILWLTGGPGCSSLFALFTEIGPYFVTSDGQNLVKNPYSWNSIASLLFFESPVGVGYSFVADEEVVSNDDTACADHYAALVQFFELYPQYKSNDFYVTGESYAGIYIPMLASKILENYRQYPLNIKGLVIGNGVLDLDLRFNTFILFAYYHGFIDESAWQRAKTECCLGDIDACDFTRFSAGFCKYFFDKAHHDARYALLLYRYNMYADCIQSKPRRFKRYSLPMQSDVEKLTCTGVRATAFLMNRDDVRDALLIPKNATPWRSCGDTIKYQKIYKSMQNLLKGIINWGIKVLLHYGDLDLVCNFIHGEKFAQQLGYRVTEPKEPFAVNGKHAGFITKYGDLEVAIVHGAGHMVPTDKPDVALYLLEDFVKGSTPIFSQITENLLLSITTPPPITLPTVVQYHYQTDSNISSVISLPQRAPDKIETDQVINYNEAMITSASPDPLYDRIAIAIMLFVAEILVIILRRF